jgi:hypothetical protein
MLVTSLPSVHKTPRMRVWRALKGFGAQALRDGVYVLPDSAKARTTLKEQADDVIASGGSAHVVSFTSESDRQQQELIELFDRGREYAALLATLGRLKRRVAKLSEAEARRAVLAVRRELDALIEIDFFPDAARAQVEAALADVEAILTERFSPEEPHPTTGRVARLDRTRYCARRWATRERLWIDRVASAWLIRRFIDPQATFHWLKRPEDCPKRTVGFDFDGAEFTHVGGRVTFEVLVAAFGLADDHALARIGALVHYLDVGGVALPEVAGLAAVASGMRAAHASDDAFLKDMTGVFDALYTSFAGQAEETT